MFRARRKDTESQKRKRAAYQPRPALGRRPWFALLRRARSLRRFAFAMRRESVARSGEMLTVTVPATGWTVQLVAVARTPFERWRGVRNGPTTLLLRTSRVHGRGLREPLLVIGIDLHGEVLIAERLDPGRFLRARGASWILEVPVGHEPPAPGSHLEIYARRRGRRKADHLCDSHREPG